jgi:FtsZ-interacting cell division protein YlmF
MQKIVSSSFQQQQEEQLEEQEGGQQQQQEEQQNHDHQQQGKEQPWQVENKDDLFLDHDTSRLPTTTTKKGAALVVQQQQQRQQLGVFLNFNNIWFVTPGGGRGTTKHRNNKKAIVQDVGATIQNGRKY